MKRSTAEDQGIPASVIDRYIRALGDEATDASHAVHSVMVLRHGHVIGEGWWHPFRAEDRHMLYSLSKSFTATAVGLAVFERRLTVNDRVVDLLPDEVPVDVGPNLAAMTVRDLLTMTSGHAVDTKPPPSAGVENWARAILSVPVEHLPGTHWVYNSGATYLLSAILHRLTGERLLDYLTPRLLDPLGIVGATWEQCPRGIDVGGSGMAITTENIATFGQLMLDGGVWKGRQLVPAEWVTDATDAQVSNGDPTLPDDGTQGYGYQFWRNRHQTYRADGAFGQMSIVIPEHDVVVALTSGHTDAQRLRDITWAVLLPGLEASLVGAGQVGADQVGADQVGADQVGASQVGAAGSSSDDAFVAALELPHPVGTAYSASDISGDWSLDVNPLGIDAIALDPIDGGVVLRMRAGDTELVIDCGYREWRRGTLVGGIGPGELTRGGPIAASGAWVADEFTAVVWLTETPYAQIVTLAFERDQLEIQTRPNVSFADPVVAQRISGRR